MSFTRIFKTFFDGVEPDLDQYLGGGAISEPGSGTLTVSCAASSNCNIEVSSNTAPMAYIINSGKWVDRILMAEARLTSFTRSNDEAMAWIGLIDSTNPLNWAVGGWDARTSGFRQQHTSDGIWYTNHQAGFGDPNTTPHRYRLFWNPWNPDLTDGTYGVTLHNNSYIVQFSEDDGLTWFTAATSRTLIWNEEIPHVGVGFSNMDPPYPAITTTWDYLEISVQDPPARLDSDSSSSGTEHRFARLNLGGPPKHQAWDGYGIGYVLPGNPDQEYRHPDPKGPMDYSGYEDGPMDLRDVSGPVKWQSPEFERDGRLGAGQVLPGPADQPAQNPTLVGPIPTGGFEDGPYGFPAQAGTKDHSLEYDDGVFLSSMQPEISQGGGQDAARRHETGFEDTGIAVLDPPVDYISSGLDGDGKALLGGAGVEVVKLFDISQEPFGNPTPSNHYYGAAKDGKWYVDGEATLQGGFGVAALNTRSWIFSSVVPQQAATDNGAPVWVASGHISLSGTLPAGASWKTYTRVKSQYRWALTGDFDIQVDFENLTKTASGITHWEGYLIAHAKGGQSSIRMGVVIRTDNIRHWRADTNSWENEYATATVSGKLRLTRVGSTATFYRDDGIGGWVSLGSRSVTGNIETAPCFVQVQTAGYEAVTGTLEFKDFVINSGTLSYDVGWALESGGAHRGNLNTMPDSLLVVGTITSLDLIDADTDLLWMRFVRGSLNVLDQWNTNLQVTGVSWFRNGVLNVAFGEVNGIEGAVFFIYFNTGEVSLRRITSSSITSATYYPTRYAMLGGIPERNNARNWSGDDSDLAIPSNSVHDVDSICTDDPPLATDRVYYAIATQAGVAVQTYIHLGAAESPRKFATSSETGRMRFCLFDQVTNDLYYIDGTNVMYVLRATLDASINGSFGYTFTADTSKALPGTRDYFSQYSLTRFGTFIYVPANEGVYKVDWPGGSFALEYGKVGSGAANEILPPYDRITRVQYALDGTDNVLLVGQSTEDDNSVVAVKMNDHTLWARSISFPGGRYVTEIAV